MKNGLPVSRPRIDVADVLRGFAVMSIMLLHNIEHFNLYDFPQSTTPFFIALDQAIWEIGRASCRERV